MEYPVCLASDAERACIEYRSIYPHCMSKMNERCMYVCDMCILQSIVTANVSSPNDKFAKVKRIKFHIIKFFLFYIINEFLIRLRHYLIQVYQNKLQPSNNLRYLKNKKRYHWWVNRERKSALWFISRLYVSMLS